MWTHAWTGGLIAGEMAEGPFEGTCISVVEHCAERCWAKEDPRLPNSGVTRQPKCVDRRVSALRQRPTSTPFARRHSAENFCAVEAIFGTTRVGRHGTSRVITGRKRLAILMHEGTHRCFLRNEARDMALSQWLCAYMRFLAIHSLTGGITLPITPVRGRKTTPTSCFRPEGRPSSPSTTRC